MYSFLTTPFDNSSSFHSNIFAINYDIAFAIHFLILVLWHVLIFL